MVFFTSDQHYYHGNIIDLCGRPFGSVEEMNKALIKEHNRVVSPDDFVYHLGDFSFGTKLRTKEILGQLNGIHRLIMGNHDRAHSVSWWMDCGFNRVYDEPILLDKFFLLSHEPLEWVVNKPFNSFYGHVHNRADMVHTTNNSCIS